LEGPNDSREVPRKQKMRGPERRGIARAVSPKKIGKERKEMSEPGNVGERRLGGRVGSKVTVIGVLEVTDDGARRRR
jgi:hypothetical protein